MSEEIRAELFDKEPFLRHARRESLKSTYQHKIGCICVNGGSVLARGYNKIRHNRIGRRYTKWAISCHAERDTLTKIQKENIKGSVLYIYREGKRQIPMLAAPCPECLVLCREMGVKKLVYTIDDPPYYTVIRL